MVPQAAPAASAPLTAFSIWWSGCRLLTIILSRGDIFVLGEAYAFGVMWSFSMKGLAVLVLRYTEPGKREYRVPLNFHIGEVEIPLGLALITLTLIALCVINLFTKEVATISGAGIHGHFLYRVRDFRSDHPQDTATSAFGTRPVQRGAGR